MRIFSSVQRYRSTAVAVSTLLSSPSVQGRTSVMDRSPHAYRVAEQLQKRFKN
jgi:hypothetical protein